MAPPHVPEIKLHLADEAHDLWLKTEEELETIGLQPPFWAFAWAGGQGLARYILDNPDFVRGKRVLDFATGSGLVAIAAAKSGAFHVTASDIDTLCEPAVAMNAAANDVEISFTTADLTQSTDAGFDVVLAGDVFFDQAMSKSVTDWFNILASGGTSVLVGDPGRAYLPKDRLQHLETYMVPVTRALEDADVKKTSVWKFLDLVSSSLESRE